MAEEYNKHIDLLDEDKPIADQKFACVSFVSPENIIQDKHLFRFEKFLNHWDMYKSLEKYNQFLNFLSFKYEINFNDLTTDFQEFIDTEKENIKSTSNISDDYKNFIDLKESMLDEEFNKTVNFQTSTRGLKIRGVFPSQEEAELRCKILREIDPHHDVYIGPVGIWMPWEPEAYKTGRVEYLEDELNQLMFNKNKNEKQAKLEFDKRVKNAKQEAIENNIKKATETNNKLTQNIDNDGNLFSVDTKGNNNEVDVSELRKELFENENVVIGESDHGAAQLLERLEKQKQEKQEKQD